MSATCGIDHDCCALSGRGTWGDRLPRAALRRCAASLRPGLACCGPFGARKRMTFLAGDIPARRYSCRATLLPGSRTRATHVRGRLPSPLEPNQLANKQGVANPRAREFERQFSTRRKQPSLVVLHARKPRAPSRHAPDHKVLRTLRISGDIYRTPNPPSELTRVSF